MKFLLYISCVAVLLSMSGLCMASAVATVHGVAYEWSTFEPIDNAIIEVNSTPVQSMVAKSGVYSFDLPDGTYLIKATYYQNDSLTHYGEEVINVSGEGNYVVDLLLLPSFTSSGLDSAAVDPEATGLDTSGSSSGNGSGLITGASVTLIAVLLILFYQVRYRKKGSPVLSHLRKTEHADAGPVMLEPASFEPSTFAPDKTDPDLRIQPVSHPEDNTVCGLSHEIPSMGMVSEAKMTERSSEPIPADLQEILDILKSQGGRITQKDMRKRLKYSEGKVSLMILDLEKRGKIQKFKKGRGNVLFLAEDEN